MALTFGVHIAVSACSVCSKGFLRLILFYLFLSAIEADVSTITRIQVMVMIPFYNGFSTGINKVLSKIDAVPSCVYGF